MLQPFDADYVRDPYAVFRDLREGQPVYYDESVNAWVLSRYSHVQLVLRDPETFGNALTLAPMFPVCPHAGQLLGALNVDPVTIAGDAPEHTRTRKAIVECFPTNARGVLVYEDDIRRRVQQLVSDVAGNGKADLISEVAWVLPIMVIMDLLGVPDTDFDKIKKWSDGLISMIWAQPDDDEQVRLAQSLLEFWAYCQELVADRVENPQEDLPSSLLRYRGGDDEVLTVREIASIAFNFLVAGHETTANLVGNGVYNLLSTKGAWEKLVDNPAGIPLAVEEMLRFSPPIISWIRMTKKDVAVGDVVIPEGQRVLVLLGSANHDTERFPNEPEVFDIERRDSNRHTSFGVGAHFCVGAALARLEAKVALEALVEFMPDLAFEPGFEPNWIPNVAFRGLRSLPVQWGA